MKREDLTAYLVRHGWTVDNWGHYHKGEYRFKFQDRSVRLEKRVLIGGKNEWLRIKSGYFGQLSINVDDKIVGLAR